MTNRYPGTCEHCGGRVAKNAGTLRRVGAVYAVAHLACAAAGTGRVINCYSPVTGNSWSVNARGRCEDAPCCGCCT